MKHLRTTFDLGDKETCLRILHRAQELKRERRAQCLTPTLAGRVVAMLFEKQSTRTRISFEAGVALLGGSTVVLQARDTQATKGEISSDAARVIGGYVDALVTRTYDHQDVEEYARFSEIPVINGMSSLDHPCQVLADVLTVYERKENPFELIWAWVGDTSSVANALVAMSSILKFELRIGRPDDCPVDAAYLEQAQRAGAKITITKDPVEAVTGAHVVSTDSWSKEGEDEWAERLLHYQLNDALLRYAAEDHFVLHSLPARRGQEITEDVMEGRHSLIFEQAENRLPIQQAILEWLMELTGAPA
jgi:ornithine carbamoyltransferase